MHGFLWGKKDVDVFWRSYCLVGYNAAVFFYFGVACFGRGRIIERLARVQGEEDTR